MQADEIIQNIRKQTDKKGSIMYYLQWIGGILLTIIGMLLLLDILLGLLLLAGGSTLLTRAFLSKK